MQIKELCAARDDPDGGAQQGELTAAQKTMCEKMEAIANNILITNFGLEVLWNNAALMNSTLHFLELNDFSPEAQQFVTKMINDIDNDWMDSQTAEVIMNIGKHLATLTR